MIGVSYFNFNLFVSAPFLLYMVVLEISKRESISDLLPECLFPRTKTGVLLSLRSDLDSFRN